MPSFSGVNFVLFWLRFRLHAFVEAAALRSIVIRYAGAPTATRFSFFLFFPFVYLEISLFRVFFVPYPLCLCMEGNGKSLSWMGLTRERWCCTRGLVSRLDMNTCQTSIKTDILL